jgi:hypothetical protein
MLYVFGFERYGVAVSALYFVDPNPLKGQEGPERGVRLELRALERGDLKGSIYSARPIAVDQPVWRVDLLESVAGPPGSFDRTHHHPAFRRWEPGRRVFADELTADPIGWLDARLSDLDGILEQAGVERRDSDAADAAALRTSAPDILDVVRRLLGQVRAGTAALPPDELGVSVRASWL